MKLTVLPRNKNVYKKCPRYIEQRAQLVLQHVRPTLPSCMRTLCRRVSPEMQRIYCNNMQIVSAFSLADVV